FNESKFSENSNETLKNLITSTQYLIENTENRDLIDKHISKKVLSELIIDLMRKYTELQEINQKKLWLNSLVMNIQKELQSSTASEHIKDAEFYSILLDNEKLKKFEQIATDIKREKIIVQKDVRRFKI